MFNTNHLKVLRESSTMHLMLLTGVVKKPFQSCADINFGTQRKENSLFCNRNTFKTICSVSQSDNLKDITNL